MTVFTVLAYIDAGTGSMLLQGVIAVLCTVVLFFRQIRHWLTGQIQRKK